MPVVYFVAYLVVCFHGECTRFESVPYKKDISVEFCQRMLQHMFQTQVGPYYDEIIDFEQSVPEDLQIVNSGCDTTDRVPEAEWELMPDVDKEPNQNDLRWQQEQERKI